MGCGRKLEHQEETHTDNHLNPGPWCCEVVFLTTVPPCQVITPSWFINVLQGRKSAILTWCDLHVTPNRLPCVPWEMWDDRRWGLFKRNLQPTLTLWSAFCSFGLCMAFLGPTLLDLRCQTHSSLQQITWVFFAQNFCVLVGTIIGGDYGINGDASIYWPPLGPQYLRHSPCSGPPTPQ
eukprot:g42277.t1